MMESQELGPSPEMGLPMLDGEKAHGKVTEMERRLLASCYNKASILACFVVLDQVALCPCERAKDNEVATTVRNVHWE